jgi:hypothetical protein
VQITPPTANLLANRKVTVLYDDSGGVNNGGVARYNTGLIGGWVQAKCLPNGNTVTYQTDTNGVANMTFVSACYPGQVISGHVRLWVPQRLRWVRAHFYGDNNTQADTAVYFNNVSKDTTIHVNVGWNDAAAMFIVTRQGVGKLDNLLGSTYKLPWSEKYIYDYQAGGVGVADSIVFVSPFPTMPSRGAAVAFMHEYGHTLMQWLYGTSLGYGCSGFHSIGARGECLSVAWNEGWADFIGAVSAGHISTFTTAFGIDDHNIEADSGNGATYQWKFRYMIGSDSVWSGGLWDEGPVAAILYDIYDNSSLADGPNNQADGFDDDSLAAYAGTPSNAIRLIANVLRDCRFSGDNLMNGRISGVDEFLYCMHGDLNIWTYCDSVPVCPQNHLGQPRNDFRSSGLSISNYPANWPALPAAARSALVRTWKWNAMNVGGIP